jgi:hypothetical protein
MGFNEHPGQISADTDAVLRKVALLGNSKIAELNSQSISRTLMPHLARHQKRRCASVTWPLQMAA